MEKGGSTMPNYRNMTAVEAIRHAKELSGMTADEIASAGGMGTASVNRYLRQEEAYSPGLEAAPRLCRAIGNTVLVDWLLAQTDRDASGPRCSPPSRGPRPPSTTPAESSRPRRAGASTRRRRGRSAQPSRT